MGRDFRFCKVLKNHFEANYGVVLLPRLPHLMYVFGVYIPAYLSV